MKALKISDASVSQAETVIRWLKNELTAEIIGGGFYHNRSIIRKAARKSEMKCMMAGREILGFAVFTLGKVRCAIDILEIRSKYRGLGYGHMFALNVIEMLFSRGAMHIEVECSPRSSESFWRDLGFIDIEEVGSVAANPKLILRDFVPHGCGSRRIMPFMCDTRR